MKNASLYLMILLISGCRIENESQDQKAFSTFDELCKEQSSEFVDKGAAYGPLTLFDMPYPSSPGPGRANRGVFDSEYNPDSLLKALMIGPDQLSQIRYVYQVYPHGSVVPKIFEDCAGDFYVDITSLPFQRPGRGDCAHANKWNRETDTARYAISYNYGELDENEIRPFTFQMRDTISERVLVEQKSFQLLLGGMSVGKNQSFTYIGWNQRVKTCRLSPPDLLIKQAFSKKCITNQSR